MPDTAPAKTREPSAQAPVGWLDRPWFAAALIGLMILLYLGCLLVIGAAWCDDCAMPA